MAAIDASSMRMDHCQNFLKIDDPSKFGGQLTYDLKIYVILELPDPAPLDSFDHK